MQSPGFCWDAPVRLELVDFLGHGVHGGAKHHLQQGHLHSMGRCYFEDLNRAQTTAGRCNFEDCEGPSVVVLQLGLSQSCEALDS